MQDMKNLLCRLFAAALLSSPGIALAAGVQQTFVHNGVERSYTVSVPSGLGTGGARWPLVLVLHGGGGNAAHAEAMTGFTEKANQEGFMVVYPEGSSRFKGRLLTWNAGHCCGYAMQKRVDDVAFIDALLDQLGKNYPVDPRRTYVTGMSNGGMMAHRLGIELPHRFAAIAPVVATLFGDEPSPTHPVSALMLNGRLDQAVPYQGGAPGGRFPDAWDGTLAQPALAQAAFWAKANACVGTPVNQDHVAWVHTSYHCPDGRAVEAYLIKDSGHAWPGGRFGSRRGDTPSSSLDGTALIWDFFKAHAK